MKNAAKERASGSWHPSYYSDYLEVHGMSTGCGLAQMSGVSVYLNADRLKKDIKKVRDVYRENGVGALLVTLGEDYYYKEEMLLEVGFQCVAEYHNLRHGAHYMQRLYILDIF